jgi:hypothetical protein
MKPVRLVQVSDRSSVEKLLAYPPSLERNKPDLRTGNLLCRKPVANLPEPNHLSHFVRVLQPSRHCVVPAFPKMLNQASWWLADRLPIALI